MIRCICYAYSLNTYSFIIRYDGISRGHSPSHPRTGPARRARARAAVPRLLEPRWSSDGAASYAVAAPGRAVSTQTTLRTRGGLGHDAHPRRTAQRRGQAACVGRHGRRHFARHAGDTTGWPRRGRREATCLVWLGRAATPGRHAGVPAPEPHARAGCALATALGHRAGRARGYNRGGWLGHTTGHHALAAGPRRGHAPARRRAEAACPRCRVEATPARWESRRSARTAGWPSGRRAGDAPGHHAGQPSRGHAPGTRAGGWGWGVSWASRWERRGSGELGAPRGARRGRRRGRPGGWGRRRLAGGPHQQTKAADDRALHARARGRGADGRAPHATVELGAAAS
jgi:hypothetical protein